MQLTIRIELEPEADNEHGCHCRAISVTVDGVKQETYNSVPTAVGLPSEETPVAPEGEKEEVKEEAKEEDYAEEEKDAKV